MQQFNVFGRMVTISILLMCYVTISGTRTDTSYVSGGLEATRITADSATISVLKGVKTIRDSTYFYGGVQFLRLKTPYVLADSIDIVHGLNVGGNIGIGTNNPSQKIHVSGGNIYATGAIFSDYSCYAQSPAGEGTYVGVFKELGSLPGYPGSRYPTIKTDYGSLYFSAGGKFSGYIGGTNAAFYLNDSSVTNKVLINTNGNSFFMGGNVGIGTSSPACKLDVNGEIRSNVTIRGQYVYAYNNTAQGSYVGVFKGIGELPGFTTEYYPVVKTDNNNLYFSVYGKYSAALGSSDDATDFGLLNPANASEKKVYFHTNGNSYLNGGNVGIGTSTPDSTLTVSGSTHVTGNVLIGGTINTGLGATEVYPMDQSVATTGTPTFAKINTGLGATEAPVYTNSAFACSLFDGITYRAVVTAHYQKVGDCVTLSIPAVVGLLTGGYTYLKTIPIAINPDNLRYLSAYTVSNGTNMIGRADIAAQAITIGKSDGSPLDAGLGGLGDGGLTITYIVN